ncbi:MAG: hypothetical protein DRJ50_06600 [Actinobacteria bacterium]|nr:MAG: hypothetical protein DRJ50_06600 [Actinomycetota bacterium]
MDWLGALRILDSKRFEGDAMSFFGPTLNKFLADHHGIIDRETLVNVGVSAFELERFVDHGSLVPVHRGVYQSAAHPESFLSRCLAACLADTELTIGGPSAARLWNFKHTGRQRELYAIVSHNRTPVTRGVILRRSNVLGSEDSTRRADGIRLTTPERTWFDRARDMQDEWFEALTEHVLDNHCSVPTLWATTKRLSARGRPGAARANRVLGHRAAWQKPADSTLEHQVLSALEQRGIPLVRQFRLELPNGSVIHLDGADPLARWGVEIDHVTWHGGRRKAQDDKIRDRNARRMGWQVDRVTDQEWADDPGTVINELCELHGQVANPQRAIS